MTTTDTTDTTDTAANTVAATLTGGSRSGWPTHLLWIDLESTGLDTSVDEIIEVGVILTDLDHAVIREFHTIVIPSDSGWHRLAGNPFVANMHQVNGLADELITRSSEPGLGIEDAQQHVLDLIETAGLSDALFYIAGSGVASFDRPMVNRLMPQVAAKLHYAPIDVGILRRTYKMATGSDLVSVNQDKTHRAIDDVRCHLAESIAFRQMFIAHADPTAGL